MNERLFGIHGAALTLRSERMGVIASNIANAATPGYKARDIDFGAALDARLASQRGDGAATSDPRAGMVWRNPTMPSALRSIMTTPHLAHTSSAATASWEETSSLPSMSAPLGVCPGLP
ncbi:MAG: flagellar basal body protein, partial [Erythrobacteraceae bacterium]|nr:flagellar basal body protein [Erythrobacteraceae bacterium]